jgi:peptide/nickel transport system permease protein
MSAADIADRGTAPDNVPAHRRAGRRPHRVGLPIFPSAVLVVVLLAALFAPWLTPHDPTVPDITNRFRPPIGFSAVERTALGTTVISGTWTHPLGTDGVGRDVLSRLLHGARYSMGVAALAILFSATIGTTIGLLSGYVGGLFDTVVMRLVDVFYSFPVILLALLLAVARGPGLVNVVVAIVFILWTRFARVMRGEALALRNREFILQARVNGLGPWQILLRHVLPNTVPTLTVLVSLQLGYIVLVEASLSYLGAGLPPVTPAWGVMIQAGQAVLREAWWVATVPGLAIMLVVLAFNLLGDWLRDALDPKMRNLA